MTFKKPACRKLVSWIVFPVMWVALSYPGLAQPTRYDKIPAEGMPTLLDLGATACVPCKMMAPILEKLEREYRGRAAVIFVDVWIDATEAKRFGIRTIPTQIFFDKNGDEFWRHEGFLDEKTIVTILDTLLKRSDDPKDTRNEQTVSAPAQPPKAEPDDPFQIDALITFFVICGVILVIIAGFVLIALKRKKRQNQT